MTLVSINVTLTRIRNLYEDYLMNGAA